MGWFKIQTHILDFKTAQKVKGLNNSKQSIQSHLIVGKVEGFQMRHLGN